MTIPITPQISLSSPSFSVSGQTITASVTMPNRPDYQGKPAITGLTTITPKIVCSRTPTGILPFHIQVSASETTCDAGNAYRDLHYSWDFGDSAGAEVFTDYFNGESHNVNTQDGPEAAYLYRNAGTYTVTLTVTGKDENGTLFTASTSTINVIGIHYYWLANATGGTFTLSFNGSPTAPIAYNATAATVKAALVLLTGLDSTNVLCLPEMGTVQLIGDQIGVAYTLTGDFTSLTGTNGTAAIANQRVHSANASVTVNDLSGLTEVYFDPTYGGGNGSSIGTIDRPYTTTLQLETTLRSSNNVAYLKRGTTLTMNQNVGNLSYYNTNRILPYGSGARPIISASTYSFVFPILFTTSYEGDYVFSEIDFVRTGTSANGFFFAYPSDSGTAGQRYGVVRDVVWDSCNFTNANAANQSVYYLNFVGLYDTVGNSGRGNGASGCGVWGGVIDMGNGAGQGLLIGHTDWFSLVGTAISGGNGNIVLDHHVYPTVRNHQSYKYIGFGLSTSKNFCINTNAQGFWGVHKNMLVDGCDITGTSNGIDASNSNNSYGGGYDGYIDDLIIQFNKIHCGQVGTQNYAFQSNNLEYAVLRYNDLWGNTDGDIYSGDTTKPTKYVIHNNRFFDGKIIVENGQTAYFHNNTIHSSSTTGVIRFSDGATNVELWDADNNKYYAPSSTQPFYNVTGAAFISFATWQGYGNDASGSVTDPAWYAPSSGQFIKTPVAAVTWPGTYTTLESSIDGGDNWVSYTNSADLGCGTYLTDQIVVLFRANTDSGGSVVISGTSNAANVDTTEETFSAPLTSYIGTFVYLINAGGLVFSLRT